MSSAKTESVQSAIGAGIYSPAEAARYTGIASGKIMRWFRGHQSLSGVYSALWQPKFESSEGQLFLSFRDLAEIRVAEALIKIAGLSPQKVRKAIILAREMLNDSRPLSSARFKTDGRNVFLKIANEGEDDERNQLLDIFRSQFAFARIVEPSLKDLDYIDTVPTKWWIAGREKKIVIDPKRAFGRPIDEPTSVPTSVLANAFIAEGGFAKAARAYAVPVTSVRRAVEFEKRLAA